MTYKLTCPSCDTYTSAAFQAFDNGLPCPHCGSSLSAASAEYYLQLPDDQSWAWRAGELQEGREQ